VSVSVTRCNKTFYTYKGKAQEVRIRKQQEERHRVSNNCTVNGYNKAMGAIRPGIFFPSITHFM